MFEKDLWPALEYEDVTWDRTSDELLHIPKSRRRKITGNYEAAVPLRIADRDISLPTTLRARISDALVSAARFDERQRERGYGLPVTLLRSESSASSQIENLTASVRNIALAELSADAPHNARLIAGNVAAMREALALPDELSIEGICRVHRALLEADDGRFAGELRSEQVWIGGTPYSPHGARFVPPRAERVADALDDLFRFIGRDDLDPIAKAAVAHAQFETIHPFIDGNGRTGRALLAKSLRNEGLLRNSILPLSAGLLHDIDAYLSALDAYHEGDPLPMVEQLTNALELAIVIGSRTGAAIDELMADWTERITQRRGSRIYDLPKLLVVQPVVDSSYVAEHLDLSQRGARDLLDLARSYGIVRPIGNARRSIYYQADELLTILDKTSSVEGIRRLLRS